uniref:Dishevelled binding antagonist of beta catenin 3 n=1 Tax=Cavia porcellus TaxID=10141 RepID=H0WCA9_CAVPO
MIRAFSFPVSPERGRLRGWLEGSLAGLCELHWLRERQEYRVQQALRLAQPGMGGAEAEDEEDADEDEDAAAARRAAAALEEQLEALPGLIWDLGQQLGDLSLESGGLDQESGRSSGFYEDPSSTGGPDSPPSTFCGDSGFSGSGSYGRLGPSEPRGIYASERPKSLGDASPSTPESVGARAAVPRSYSAPYPTAAGSAGPDACSSAERRARAGLFLTPSPLHAGALRSPRPCGRSPVHSPDGGVGAGRPLDGYISELLHRRRRRGAGQPRTIPGGANGFPRRQNSVRQRPPDASPPPGGARPAREPSLERAGVRAAAPEPPVSPAAPSPPDSPAEGRLVKAQYIPAAQAATRGFVFADGRRGRPRAPAPAPPGPCRPPSAPQRPSALWLRRQRLRVLCRPPGAARPPRAPGGVGGGYGESESSASEGESPAFSSASSDSDGSGGLVWPQQLVAASGPGGGAGGGAPAGPAKVFVKIKASHALKKKILRFRSGSLKVMTTV